MQSQNLADLHLICRFLFLKSMWQLFYFPLWHQNYSLPTAWKTVEVISIKKQIVFPMSGRTEISITGTRICSTIHI
jgi:hypothetical protein